MWGWAGCSVKWLKIKQGCYNKHTFITSCRIRTIEGKELHKLVNYMHLSNNDY